MKILFALLAAMLLSAPMPAFARPFIQIDSSERAAFQNEVRNLFRLENFDELESMARDLRENKSRFSGGYLKLPTFYNALCIPETSSETSYRDLFDRIGRWEARFPGSVTARVVEGETWLNYAWFARGNGYADTVSELGWSLFKQRAQKAYEVLGQPPAGGDCPERYNQLLTVALALGWDRDAYEKVFDEAVAFDPSYYPFYLKKVVYLLPRWYGNDGEWQKFADDAVKLAPTSEGMAVYTRITLATFEQGEWNSFGGAGVSWPKMRQGFRDLERQYPGSRWNLNLFAMFAAIADDSDTASELFAKIGDDPDLEVFGSRKNYDYYRNRIKASAIIPKIYIGMAALLLISGLVIASRKFKKTKPKKSVYSGSKVYTRYNGKL